MPHANRSEGNPRPRSTPLTLARGRNAARDGGAMYRTPHTTISLDDTCIAVTITGDRAMPKIAWITSITAAVCATSSGTSTFWYTCSGPMVTHTFAATVRT